jgi:hypothetical protein
MRYLWIPLVLACAASGEEWLEVNVHHEDNTDTESFQALQGALKIIPKTSLSGEMTLTHQVEGIVQCTLDYTAEDDEWRSDCTLCDEAFDIVASEVEILVNLNNACLPFQNGLLHAHPALGFGDETLYVDFGDGWQNTAETWYADGRTHFEWDLSD